jgi:hypothetical protein
MPFALLTTTFALALPAHSAGLTRTFVSSAGSDSNPCTITQPCLTFAHAYTVTAASGIVAALDPGKYGPLTITGPVTINGNGWASITAPANGIGINVNASAGTVNLRGLVIDASGGAGSTGIVFNTGSVLNVENCTISNMGLDGIDAGPGGSSLLVSDTVVSNNGGSGISIASATPGNIYFTASRVQTNNNGGDGIAVSSTQSVFATVTDSVAANNGQAGFYSNFTGGGDSGAITLTIMRSVAANNSTGLLAPGIGLIEIGQSVVSGNQIGWSGPAIVSFGTNQIEGNNAGQTAPPTSPLK